MGSGCRRLGDRLQVKLAGEACRRSLQLQLTEEALSFMPGSQRKKRASGESSFRRSVIVLLLEFSFYSPSHLGRGVALLCIRAQSAWFGLCPGRQRGASPRWLPCLSRYPRSGPRNPAAAGINPPRRNKYTELCKDSVLQQGAAASGQPVTLASLGRLVPARARSRPPARLLARTLPARPRHLPGSRPAIQVAPAPADTRL